MVPYYCLGGRCTRMLYKDAVQECLEAEGINFLYGKDPPLMEGSPLDGKSFVTGIQSFVTKSASLHIIMHCITFPEITTAFCIAPHSITSGNIILARMLKNAVCVQTTICNALIRIPLCHICMHLCALYGMCTVDIHSHC